MVEFSRRALLGGAAGAAAVATLPASPGWAGHDQWPRFLAGADLIWKRLPTTWYEGPFLGNGFLASGIYARPSERRPLQRAAQRGAGPPPAVRVAVRPGPPAHRLPDAAAGRRDHRRRLAARRLERRAARHDHDRGGQPGACARSSTPDRSARRRGRADRRARRASRGRSRRRRRSARAPTRGSTAPRRPGTYRTRRRPSAAPAGSRSSPSRCWPAASTRRRGARSGAAPRARCTRRSPGRTPTAAPPPARCERSGARRTCPPTRCTIGHRVWWHRFYRKSFLSIPDAKLQSFYWIQLYKIASAARRDAPDHGDLRPVAGADPVAGDLVEPQRPARVLADPRLQPPGARRDHALAGREPAAPDRRRPGAVPARLGRRRRAPPTRWLDAGAPVLNSALPGRRPRATRRTRPRSAA